MTLFAYEPEQYDALFDAKAQQALATLASFNPPRPALFPSDKSGFRLRAEFRMWHDGDELNYVMFPAGKPKAPETVDRFPIASQRIEAAMPPLRDYLSKSNNLRRKLFQVEFLSTLSGELLVTLIYHRPLEETWKQEAAALGSHLNCKLIGRARKQKIVVEEDWVEECLALEGERYNYRQPDQCFTQPNGVINRAMIEWLLSQCGTSNRDLLELYCGIGNFTLPLASRFRRVLATELNKRATAAAEHNATANKIQNVSLARLSAQEMASARAGVRAFRRLANLEPPLAEWEFETLLVDPPRAGLDPTTLALASDFDRVLYISCNPETLAKNMAELSATHRIDSLAFFDQFPYTPHLEVGMTLSRKPT
jgi:tRNA (uracil-5-)-methyltransferase